MDHRRLLNLDLNLVMALDALLQTASVTAAAARLGRSPSAVSHALARLRAELDDPLLVRAGRSLQLTPRAAALRPRVGALLHELDAVLRPAAPVDPSAFDQAFRIDGTDHAALLLLPELHRRLAEAAPQVDLHLRPIRPEAPTDVRDDQTDLAIGVFGDLPPDLDRLPLLDDRFVVVCRADHPILRPGVALSLDLWCALPHLLVAPRGTPHGTVDRVLAAEGRRRRVARSTPSFLAAGFLVEQSDLLLTVSARVAHFLAARAALRLLPPPIPLPGYTLEAIWHRRLRQDPAHRWLRDQLSQVAAGLAAPTALAPGAAAAHPLG